MENLEKLLDLDTAELNERLGAAVAAGASSLGPKALRVLGAEWLESRKESLKKLICSDPAVSSIRDDGSTANSLALAGAIADAISAAHSYPAVYTIAALLVKQGIDGLCP